MRYLLHSSVFSFMCACMNYLHMYRFNIRVNAKGLGLRYISYLTYIEQYTYTLPIHVGKIEVAQPPMHTCMS